jgi:hypothetical protein
MPTRLDLLDGTRRINGLLSGRYLQLLARADDETRPACLGGFCGCEVGLERITRFPMLLIDCHFGDASWWRQQLMAPATLPIDPNEELSALCRDVLLALWCLLDAAPAFRCLTGVTPAVARVWESVGIDRLLSHCRGCAAAARPRWCDASTFWQGLAYTAATDQGWDTVQMHALQLCGRDQSQAHE